MSFAHHHAEAYIQNLRHIPGVELLGVADEDAARGQSFAERFWRRITSLAYEDLIEAKPDGVIICIENNKHRPLVEMAAAHGVNVLCEKPIATTLADARAEVEACERAGVSVHDRLPDALQPAPAGSQSPPGRRRSGSGVLLQCHQPG